MPVDEFGIRADILIDMNSPVARNNPGQLYEMGLNRISEFVRRKVAQVLEVKGSDPAFEVLLDWYNDVNPNWARLVRENCPTAQDRRNVVNEAIATSPKLWVPPFLDNFTPSSEDFWNAISNMDAWATKWGVSPSKVKFKVHQDNGEAKEFISETEFSIGSKYILHLHKVPEIFSPGPASVNHIGIPTKSNYENKYFPVSNNPYRYGEDEIRVISMSTDIREVSRFLNLMANSPSGVAKTIQTLLLAENPTSIKRIPISNGDLSKSSVVLKLLHNTTAVLGVETKSTKIDRLDVPEELTDSIWQSDVANLGSSPVNMFEDDDVVIKKSSTRKSKVKKMLEDLVDNDDVTIDE